MQLGLIIIYENNINEIMKTKMKSESHIIDTVANTIIREIIPDHWTIREYRPDYGIDLAIEIFEKTSDEKYMTLGEHLFIQVKGIKNPVFKSYAVKGRDNVEKSIRNYKSEDKSINVLSCQLETSELYTIQRMSCVIPVMLFVVDISAKDIYYINLNDYIDKVLIPKDPKYTEKQNKTIHIPIENKLSLNNHCLKPLMLYAKRPKYYAFFNKVAYQFNELSYLIPRSFSIGIDRLTIGEYDSIMNSVNHFIKILKTIDVWDKSCSWSLLAEYEKKVDAILNGKIGTMFPPEQPLDPEDPEECKDIEHSNNWSKLVNILQVWEDMDNFHNIYEEFYREFWLPTWIYRDTFF